MPRYASCRARCSPLQAILPASLLQMGNFQVATPTDTSHTYSAAWLQLRSSNQMTEKTPQSPKKTPEHIGTKQRIWTLWVHSDTSNRRALFFCQKAPETTVPGAHVAHFTTYPLPFVDRVHCPPTHLDLKSSTHVHYVFHAMPTSYIMSRAECCCT